MSKQTAVEWLEQKIEKLLPDFIGVWQEEFEQAKAMEREQIIEAWIATDNELQRLTAEKYYNETYKGGSNE